MQGTPVLAYSVHKWDSTGPCSSHDIYNRKQILMVETYKKKYRKYRRVLNHLYNTDILASIFTSYNLHFIYAGLTGRHTSTVPILCTHIATDIVSVAFIVYFTDHYFRQMTEVHSALGSLALAPLLPSLLWSPRKSFFCGNN